MAVAIAWLPGPAGTRRRVAKLSVEEPDAAEPARPDLWGARVSNDPGLPDLNSASRTIEQTGMRRRAMERTLRSVAQMPDDEAARILNLPARSEEIEEAIEREETETTTDMAGNDEDDGV